MIVDLSFTNQQIKGYFEGSGSYVPSSEIVYIHTHPLIKPNFLDEIEAIVNKTAVLIEQKKIRGSVIDRFTKLAINLGVELPGITLESAPAVLSHLRDIYKLCNDLLKSYDVK